MERTQKECGCWHCKQQAAAVAEERFWEIVLPLEIESYNTGLEARLANYGVRSNA